jgi:glycosyltransferase involved in cell wall biosynthesis
MADPAISVVLPVRDGAPTLERAVRSVLASTGPRLELICVDDGSSDETSAILGTWSRRDARVRVRTQPALGIVAALNAGLRAARAPLVARMDADDEMHPERLGAQAERLEAEPGLALVGCLVESFRDGGLLDGYRLYTEWVNGLVEPDEIAREAFIECPIPHPTWMLRRDVVLGLGGYRERGWPEDLELLYRLLAAGHRVAKVPRQLHRWRDHDLRLSRVDPRYGRESFARAKAHWIGRLHPMPAAVVWGAGRTGRRFVRLLADEGLATEAMIDIRPERIGTCWRGIPIVSPASLAERTPAWRARGLRVLAAVASRGARPEIRQALVEAGLAEGQDFWMVA